MEEFLGLPDLGALPDSPEHKDHQAPSFQHKSARVLACIQCQQRKIKCDRKFPCANCAKYGVQCVPAVQARRRRRRFPERDLLDRLRKYEDLLRQNNIKFDPMHGDSNVDDKDSPHHDDDDHGTRSSEDPEVFEVRSLWDALAQDYASESPRADSKTASTLEADVKQAWEQSVNESFLFGFRDTAVDLSTFHPDAVQIFRLWQIYLDNVDPMLKVTHTPTLQSSIIEAATNVSSIGQALEALMFGIYCIAIVSLTEDECLSMFGQIKDQLVVKYQFGCRQALMNARFLRTTDRDCLTALYLYMLSQPPLSDARPMFVIFGIAIRIAQAMGINSEKALAKETPFEAEMRRRLWWSLMLTDARRTEMADSRDSTLAPTWTCKVPLNINDSALRKDMKEPPESEMNPTDTLFVYARSALADIARNKAFHLDFTNPALKAVARPLPPDALEALGTKIERDILGSCDLENPVNHMSLWSTRAYLARCRIMQLYITLAGSNVVATEAQLDKGMELAITMLECDFKLHESPRTTRFAWYMRSYFPFPAFMHLLEGIKKRPHSQHCEKAWNIMGKCLAHRYPSAPVTNKPLIRVFNKNILAAWDIYFAAQASPESVPVPRLISTVREHEAVNALLSQPAGLYSWDAVLANQANFGMGAAPMPGEATGMDFFGHNPFNFVMDDFEKGMAGVESGWRC
ncbi:hypothetical protein B0I35DRAFT_348801 [Stachybotrys elegans]|uniref:Zn(2)-C6 fungal-type domain-containing protein n=1 Tax=Stachybotrys elegans TaxID=80388 RepID=A0A8K0WU30_9HYPO|nr:hypothetical protein B0I35DRAFT_348801 [Stachybotrys elegans]